MRRENPCGSREENVPFSFLSVPAVGTEAQITYNKRKNTTKQLNSRRTLLFGSFGVFCGNGSCRKSLSVSLSPLT